MGYQPGQGLGKTASGAAVPIAVEIKSKRTGLGVDEAHKERQTHQAEMQLLRGTLMLKADGAHNIPRMHAYVHAPHAPAWSLRPASQNGIFYSLPITLPRPRSSQKP